jgi:hypothetical protein|tara:strand:+ start:775 stop:906 length:132 start_codon:yes stop_codon:yes gene_type:complete
MHDWTIEITVENEEQVQALLDVIEEAEPEMDFAFSVRVDRHET